MERVLAGLAIGVTGHRRWEEQAELLTRRGARVVHGPAMATSLLHDASATLAATAEVLARPVHVIVLTTGIGTRSWFGGAARRPGSRGDRSHLEVTPAQRD